MTGTQPEYPGQSPITRKKPPSTQNITLVPVAGANLSASELRIASRANLSRFGDDTQSVRTVRRTGRGWFGVRISRPFKPTQTLLVLTLKIKISRGWNKRLKDANNKSVNEL